MVSLSNYEVASAVFPTPSFDRLGRPHPEIALGEISPQSSSPDLSGWSRRHWLFAEVDCPDKPGNDDGWVPSQPQEDLSDDASGSW